MKQTQLYDMCSPLEIGTGVYVKPKFHDQSNIIDFFLYWKNGKLP